MAAVGGARLILDFVMKISTRLNSAAGFCSLEEKLKKKKKCLGRHCRFLVLCGVNIVEICRSRSNT